MTAIQPTINQQLETQTEQQEGDHRSSVVPLGHVMVPVSQPVKFVAAGGPNVPQGGMVFMPQQAPTVLTIDKSTLPGHHLILIIIINVLCLVINVTSLLFGIPAVLCAYLAYSKKKKGKYGLTKTYSYAGVVLSYANLGYTGFITVAIITLTFSLHCFVGDAYCYD